MAKFNDVVKQLCEHFYAQGLQPGDPIPSERKIADICDVSYMTARRAVRELMDEGILKRDGLKRATIVQLPRLAEKGAPESLRKYRVLILARPPAAERSGGDTQAILSGIIRQVVNAQEWKTRFIFPAGGAFTAEIIREELAGEQADGLIVLSVYSEEKAAAIHASGIPAIILDYAPLDVPLDSIVTDNRQITHTAMKHLAGLGHNSIDFVGHSARIGKDHDAMEMEMYWAFFLDAEDHIGTARWCREGKEAAEEMADEIIKAPVKPTALFVSNLTRARNLHAALTAKGLRVPEDISIITVGWGVGDGSDSTCEISLMTVNWFEVVRAAVNRLRARMEGTVEAVARLSCGGILNDAGTTGPPPPK